MSKHSKLAKELFEEGYNCSQSVFLAFCDEMELDKEVALKISSSFGGGIGRLREVCGVVSAMAMVAGMLDGYIDPLDTEAKAEHYELVQSLALKFKEENNSIICRDLLGITVEIDNPIPEKRTEGYYQKRPCSELVECGARILDAYIQNRE